MNREVFNMYSFDDLGKAMAQLTLEGLIHQVTFESVQKIEGHSDTYVKVIASGHADASPILNEYHKSYYR